MKVTVTPRDKDRFSDPDIFRQGNMVAHKTSGHIVLVTGISKRDYEVFKGVAITGDEAPPRLPIGDYSKSWAKDCFTQFHGTIKIEL